jgi:hypothetical protein
VQSGRSSKTGQQKFSISKSASKKKQQAFQPDF